MPACPGTAPISPLFYKNSDSKLHCFGTGTPKCHLPAAGLRRPRQVQHGPAVRLGGDLPGGAGGLQLGWVFGKFTSWCQVRRAGLELKTKPELATRISNLKGKHTATQLFHLHVPPSLVPELKSGRGTGFQELSVCREKGADLIGLTCQNNSTALD